MGVFRWRVTRWVIRCREEVFHKDTAYDITFRHALDIDQAGQCLVFGTSTGSLFVSEDQGDSWQCITTHLPPVYCTRFVE